MTTLTQAAIISTARSTLRYLAARHAETPWADADAHAAYAATYRDVTFTAVGEHLVVATTPKGRTAGAADALDFAASAHDAGDGYISTDTTESMVTYYLSTAPGLAALIEHMTADAH